MMQTKSTAMILLVTIATIGAIGIGIGTGIQSAQAQCRGGFGDYTSISRSLTWSRKPEHVEKLVHERVRFV